MNTTLRKILQHKRYFKASHWNPCKLTHFNGYFDLDSLQSLSNFRSGIDTDARLDDELYTEFILQSSLPCQECILHLDVLYTS